VTDESGQSQRPRLFTDAIAAIQQGDLSQTQLGRLSDISREEARVLAAAWASIPEPTRVDLVRRFDELTEERIDLNFSRALRVALDDPSPVVRQLAVAGLWEDESRDLLDRLRFVLQADMSSDVRAAAAAGLERFSRQAALGELDAEMVSQLRQSLMDALRDERGPYAVRRRALEALGPLAAEPTIRSSIAEAYDSGDHGLQCSAVYAMGKSLDGQWLPTVLSCLEDDDPEIQFEAARAAGAIGSADALPALLEAAHAEDAEVRHAAINAIGQVGGAAARRALERLAEDAGEADLDLIESALEEVNTLLDPFASTS
jgi:HEAT repeat protein